MDYLRDLFLMQQTYATLFSLANKLQVKGDQNLKELTSRQYMVMVAIAHLPEDKITINNIARKLGTTKQSVKQMITIMEKKDYIIITPNQHDKRAVNVKITESGRKVLLEVSEKGIYFLANLFKDFSTEELEILWNLLKKLYHFDGKEQDGFEEEGHLELDKDQISFQTSVMKEFELLRKQ